MLFVSIFFLLSRHFFFHEPSVAAGGPRAGYGQPNEANAKRGPTMYGFRGFVCVLFTSRTKETLAARWTSHDDDRAAPLYSQFLYGLSSWRWNFSSSITRLPSLPYKSRPKISLLSIGKSKSHLFPDRRIAIRSANWRQSLTEMTHRSSIAR